MNRNRTFYQILSVVLLAGALVLMPRQSAAAITTKMVWGALPLAGFQYYAGKKVWQDLKVGDPLTLIREPDNPHDPNAIRVEWHGEKLGYVPRAGNASIVKLMDKGIRVAGRIVHLQPGRSHWQRVMFEVVVEE